MKTLITLGPTQEPIDRIRYITNASSGKMGRALAEESLARKFSTTIISGTVNIKLPQKAKIFSVKTAQEMTEKTLQELENNYHIFISTAAIADFTPVKVKEGKINSEKPPHIKLKSNPKLTKLVREKFPQLYMVAFKAEYGLSKEKLVKKAFEKMINEELNMVVGNDIKQNPLGSDENEVYLVMGNSAEHLQKNPKQIIAKEIWERILEDYES